MKKQVISSKNLPSRSPIGSLALVYLMMETYGASEWVYGVFITVAVLLIIAWAVSILRDEIEIDIMNGEDK